MHCAKSMARSAISRLDARPDTAGVLTLAEAMVSHGKLTETGQEMQAIIDNDFENRMH